MTWLARRSSQMPRSKHPERVVAADGKDRRTSQRSGARRADIQQPDAVGVGLPARLRRLFVDRRLVGVVGDQCADFPAFQLLEHDHFAGSSAACFWQNDSNSCGRRSARRTA